MPETMVAYEYSIWFDRRLSLSTLISPEKDKNITIISDFLLIQMMEVGHLLDEYNFNI